MADDEKAPRKYWWLVPVGVPILVAIIAIVPQVLKRPAAPAAPTGTTVIGSGNVINYGTLITNVNVFTQEYERQSGRPLSEEITKQIQAALAAAQQNNHAESIRLFEQVAKVAPVPSIYGNLAVEYAQVNKPEDARRAFELSKEKLAELTSKAPSPTAMPESAFKAPTVSGPGIRTEASGLSAMTIDPVSAPYESTGEFDIVVHGTSLGTFYRPKGQLKPGVPLGIEPGAYDIAMRTGPNSAFVLATDVEVKEGMLTHVNPNALIGGIAVQPAAKQGFPVIKGLQFVKDHLINQQTEKLGVTLPLAPGTYDVIVSAAGDQEAHIAGGVTVTAGTITRLDPLSLVAAIVVYKPQIALDMKAVYALNAGTNQIAAKAEAWDVPMLVRAGVAYDVALDQTGGLMRVKLGFTPGRGELVEIKK